jgi:hypothetical protein
LSTLLESGPPRDERGARTSVGWTAVAPLACLVHCAATPVLGTTLPFVVATPELEWGFLGATVFLGGIVLPKKAPGSSSRLPIIFLCFGLALWGASLLGILDPLPHELTTATASLATGGGLFWLTRIHRQSHLRSG